MPWRDLGEMPKVKSDAGVRITINQRRVAFLLRRVTDRLGWKVGDRIRIQEGVGADAGAVRCIKAESSGGWKLVRSGGGETNHAGSLVLQLPKARAGNPLFGGQPDRLSAVSADYRISRGILTITLPWPVIRITAGGAEKAVPAAGEGWSVPDGIADEKAPEPVEQVSEPAKVEEPSQPTSEASDAAANAQGDGASDEADGAGEIEAGASGGAEIPPHTDLAVTSGSHSGEERTEPEPVRTAPERPCEQGVTSPGEQRAPFPVQAKSLAEIRRVAKPAARVSQTKITDDPNTWDPVVRRRFIEAARKDASDKELARICGRSVNAIAFCKRYLAADIGPQKSHVVEAPTWVNYSSAMWAYLREEVSPYLSGKGYKIGRDAKGNVTIDGAVMTPAQVTEFANTLVVADEDGDKFEIPADAAA